MYIFVKQTKPTSPACLLLSEKCDYLLVCMLSCQRGEWEWPALGVLQQVPPSWPLSPHDVPGETGCKELPESIRVPADPQHHQPAGPQGWDGLHQPLDLLVSTQPNTQTQKQKYLYRVQISLVLFNWSILCVVLFSPFPLIPALPAQPASREEEEEVSVLLAALVVCVPGLVPVAVHQWSIHFLHAVVRLWIRQRKVHQVGHVFGPLPLPEHLYTAASQGE